MSRTSKSERKHPHAKQSIFHGRSVCVSERRCQRVPLYGGRRGHSGSRGLPELPGERGMAPCARRQILHHPQRLGHSGLADAQRPAHRLARRSQPQRLAHLAHQDAGRGRPRLCPRRGGGLWRHADVHLVRPAPERGRPPAGAHRRRRGEPSGAPGAGTGLHPEPVHPLQPGGQHRPELQPAGGPAAHLRGRGRQPEGHPCRRSRGEGGGYPIHRPGALHHRKGPACGPAGRIFHVRPHRRPGMCLCHPVWFPAGAR